MVNNDQVMSLVRTAAKVLSGVLVAKGIGDASAWELVISGAFAAYGIIGSALVHKKA